MRIQGIPELPEPAFRTHDDAWVSLDAVVKRVCEALHGDVSPLVAKCTIQLARFETHRADRVEIGQLAADVCQALRGERIVVTPLTVRAVLLAYASEVASLGIVQVVEGG
ncbi:MAG: hypothetical protein ACOZNI_34770 [Myxococcota bacterium]